MSTKSPDNNKNNQTIELAHFCQFAENTAAQLGSGWTVDPDSAAGPVAFLTHPDGHRIGLRQLWRGQAVQTWATDVPPREYANENDAKVMTANAAHLTGGSRYNAGVTFTHTSPATTTAKKIRTRLLPAYDGKRPTLRAFPAKRSRAKTAARSESTTSAPEPQTKQSPRKRRTAAPATRGKSTGTPRVRRTQNPETPTKKPKNTTAAPTQSRSGSTPTKAAGTKPRTTEPTPSAPADAT
ncbi:hypothetical protein RCO28_36035 [Streptomyces sp. LHD-70]|uniref:hypothetical protein n=1 Tax=Streptomyces sp. LHD-70 TaxID=3072140 RepID=UPI0028103D9D|nr:hypothetical protein [Streptomyces sp. LHD-70]MDQ8707840.1 hypothetical protein [Streptomyces sp. LHD-70]